MENFKIFRKVVPGFIPRNPKSFIVKDHFVVSACSEEKVKICYINEEFKKCFLPLVEEAEKEDKFLIRGELLRNYRDSELFFQQKHKPVRLRDIFELISQQGRGEKGVLHTKRFSFKTNIFYIKDSDNISCFIFVSFDKKKGGWNIVARKVDFFDNSKSLSKGSNFFYRFF